MYSRPLRPLWVCWLVGHRDDEPISNSTCLTSRVPLCCVHAPAERRWTCINIGLDPNEVIHRLLGHHGNKSNQRCRYANESLMDKKSRDAPSGILTWPLIKPRYLTRMITNSLPCYCFQPEGGGVMLPLHVDVLPPVDCH